MAKAKINVREKGKGYELKVAKFLSDWWGETFRRTPSSGALHWREDNRVSGDIVPPVDSIFPYSVEVKKHEGWCLEQVIKNVGEIESWWEQCCNDANNVSKKPLLCFSKNFDSDFSMMTLEDFTEAVNGIERFPVNYFIVVKPGKPTRVIFLMTEFIKYIPKQQVIQKYHL